MTVLSIIVYVTCALTVLLAAYYTLRDLSADLVLLGAAAVTAIAWIVESGALALRHLGGGDLGDPVVLYGYLLTGLILPIGGIWVGIWERSRWGSLVIGLISLTLMVLQMRLPQIWAGGFS